MEILAYCGSIIIFISFLVKSVKWLRILNNVGCLIFLIYALHHGRTPLILLNSGVILVNIWHLIKRN
jgi:ABC-type spermidine/putrescine transport system permease subunit I